MEISDIEKLLQGSTPGKWFVTKLPGLFDGDPTLIMTDEIDDAVLASMGGDILEEQGNAELFAASKSLAAELLSLKQQNEWIPVSERKPEYHEEVLFCTIHGARHVGFRYEDTISHGTSGGAKQDAWYTGWQTIQYHFVACWRELPSPPIAKQVAG